MVSKKLIYYRKALMKWTDLRVGIMNEVINGMQVRDHAAGGFYLFFFGGGGGGAMHWCLQLLGGSTGLVSLVSTRSKNEAFLAVQSRLEPSSCS
jgi:sugar/nucleoside kinase (ribokinase family)